MKLQIFAIGKFIKSSNHTSLAVIAIAYPLKKEGKYYLLMLLKECKYIENKSIGILLEVQKFLLMNRVKNKLIV